MISHALYRGLSLAAFTGLSSWALAWSTRATTPRIEDNLKRDQRQLLSEVMPTALLDAPSDQYSLVRDEVRYYVGGHAGKVKAVAFESTSLGYSGPIRVLIGTDPEGRILGVRVISHTETPGLGDRIEAKKSDWILGFDGMSLQEPPVDKWLVKKDGGAFDAMTGATITPRAVVKSVKEGLLRFEDARQVLVASYPPKTQERTKVP